MALTEKLVAIADAIRLKTGGTDMQTLDQMPAEIEAIQGGGGCADLIARSLSHIEDESVTKVGSYAFAHYSDLAGVSFPNCERIDSEAFSQCENLGYEGMMTFPNCRSIGEYAFYQCYSLSQISLPACTSIDDYAFAYCSNLVSVYLSGSSVLSITSYNVFDGTPFGRSFSGSTPAGVSQYGVYVPSNLWSSYMNHSQWSNFYIHLYSY